ncbi:MAG: lytic transglycosylase domain-containing protein [Bryobacteraceae bacterium]
MLVRLSYVLFGFALTGTCFGLELVHLKNGFTLEAASHTAEAERLILSIGNGTLSVEQTEVSSIETINGPSISSQPEKTMDAAIRPEALLADAAQAYGIDPAFIQSVARVESGLRQGAVSSKGAIGLMQLMPGTAAELQVNPHQAAANASGGARYLRELLLRYKGNSVLALAAYNAGPGAVQKYGGAPPFEETRRYIVKVLQEYEKQLKAKASTSPAIASNSRPKKPSATD